MSMLTKIEVIRGQKSIGCNQQLHAHVQQQMRQLLATPQLQNRIILGHSDDYEWQEIKCVVPLHCPVQGPQDLTTIKILIRFNKQKLWSTPGLYIESDQMPSQNWYINIIEDLCWTEIKTQSSAEIVLAIIKQIDKYGFKEWSANVFKDEGYNNKKDVKQSHSVNLNLIQINRMQKYIKNQICQQNNFQNADKNNQILQIGGKNESQPGTSSVKQGQNQLEDLLKLSNFHISNILNKELNTDDLLKINNSVKQSKQMQGELRDWDQVLDCIKSQELQNGNSYKQSQKLTLNRAQQQKNTIKLNPFSCFKPICYSSQKQQPVQKVQQKINISQSSLKSNGFKLYKPTSTQKIQRKHDYLSLMSSNGNKHLMNPNNLQLNSQTQKIDDENNDEVHSPENEFQQRSAKHTKPMNKNANLPKFLIRIFIKYIDKFKSLYIKKQYDRLYAQCRKMKQWKKNDRRQHAFGLKHLKIFFQDQIEGFPSPTLNRRVISKIIGNFLLEQICQNSQIPQCHRVGYLVACRVYSIRCRNISLAGRIQSK